MLLTNIPLLDEILRQHAEVLGKDFTPYRNHCYRVANFCVALHGDDSVVEQVAVAVAFHDIAIWTDRTFDYLDPSDRHAQAWLERAGKTSWAAPVSAMILWHHKLRCYEGDALGESFRKADMVDVSLGSLRFGLPPEFVREVRATFPNAGFHWRLVQLFSRRLLTHPWSPAPMMRW